MYRYASQVNHSSIFIQYAERESAITGQDCWTRLVDRWNGLVDWTDGLDWWTGLVDQTSRLER